MKYYSFVLTLTILLISLSAILVSAQAVDVNISGPDSTYNCKDYNYTLTVYNPSLDERAIDINTRFHLPIGYTTTDSNYSITALNPGEFDQRILHVRTRCNAAVGSLTVNGDYNSSFTFNKSYPITIYPGAVTIEKIPSTQPATLEDNVSWTITVTSSGLGYIEDVIINDTLQPGLLYLSSSPAGVVTGPGTIQWTTNEIPSLAHMEPDDQVQITLRAKVVGCTDLYDTASATWGCDGGCDTQSTQASIAFQPNPPKIDYTVPPFTLTYCGTGNNFNVSITNTGGIAYDFNLSANFGTLSVTNITSPVGASYSGGKFILGNIPNGSTNLTFDLVPSGGWCSGSLPSGTVIFEPDYLYCGTNFLPPVKIGSYSVTGVPSVSVSKTGAPSSMYLGGTVTYNIVASYSGPLNCGNSTASNIVVVDTIPAGFTVDPVSIPIPNGGSYDGNRTITWNVNPATGLNTSITLQSPDYTNCQYCYTTATNTVNATVTDCCGCTRAASSSQSTILECAETLTSNKTVFSNYNYEKCTPIEYTSTYNFANDAFWDDVYIKDLKFREELPNNQVLVSPVIITIGTCSISYTPPSSTYLDVNFSDTTLQNNILTNCGIDVNTTIVKNTYLSIEYNLSNQKLSEPLCNSATTFFDWSILNTGKTGVGNCYGSNQIRDGVFVTVNGAHMAVGLSGLPTIIDRCGTYIVTLNINRDSVGGAYDVNVSFPTTNYNVNSITINGGTPTQTSGPGGYEWKYGDFFVNNTSASIDLNVTKTCDSNGGMNANVVWHDICNDDAPDNICNWSASTSPSLILSGNVCLMKVPELLWATTDKAQWKLCLTNAGTGAGYNVWLEDVIGAGLSYNSSSGTYSQLYINQDRNGNPSNGATWIIDKINAGDKTEILFTANIDSCTNLTNMASTSGGCLGTNCQNIKTASSSIRIPGSVAQTTNRLPAFIDMCKQEPIKVIVKNSGLTTIYNVNVTVIKPNELVYVPGTGIPNDAENISASPLRWTKLQAPALDELDPGEEVNISFQVKSSCNIPQSGSVSSQSFFDTPCGTISQSQGSTSNINTRSPVITITKTGRNVTKGQVTHSAPVVAESGDTIEWKIVITNNGTAEAELVQFWDVLPTNMTYQSITPTPGGGGSGTGGDPWVHGTLAASTTTTYYVTGTVNTCQLLTTNTAYVKWGCDDACIVSTQNSVVNLRTDPEITLGQTLSNFTTCSGQIEITVTNGANRPTAKNVQVTSTLPAGFVYDYNLTTPGPNTPVIPTQPTWNLGDITAGQTKTIRFIVKDNGSACGTATQVTNSVSGIYYNSCGGQISVGPNTRNVTPLKANLTVDKSPAIQVVGVQGQANWTITVRNTGNTNANNVTVIDILDPNWNSSTIIASNGSNGEVPSIVGNTITWNISNPISGPSGTWTATLSANLINAAGTGRNDVYVRGRCPSGCTYSSATDSATIWDLEGIAKVSRKETATIGEEVIFDIAVNYHGNGSVYTDTSILDTLPGGLEYISHTFSETNSSIPHPYTQAGQSIQWLLGTPSAQPNRAFTGPNSVNIALTTKIRNISGNINGVTLINPVNTTFTQDGNPANFSDNDDVQIVEPHLTIAKDINGTTSMQALPGQSVHYKIVVTNDGTSPAFEVYIRDQVPNGLILDVGSITSTPNANGLSVSGNDIEWFYNTIINGDTVTLEYDAVVPPRGGLFVNNANVPQNGYSSMPGDVAGERYYGPLSDDTQLTTPGTDLTKLTLNTEANIPSPGGVVYYSLTIDNSGALPLEPVQLIDTLPDGLTYIPGSSDINSSPLSDPAIVQNLNGTETLTWSNLNSLLTPTQPNMPIGQFIIVRFQARVDPGRVGIFINEATVIGTVINLGNVTDTDDSPVGVKVPAINIIKSVQPPYGKVGFENQFTLKVTNTGEVPLNPVSVVDTLPIGLVYANSANLPPDSVIVNGDGTTTITWDNIGALAVGESRLVIFSAKFNGLENRSINKATTEGWPPNGDSVTDDDQVEILKKAGADPKETLKIITKGYMKRCDLCYDHELNKEARKYITNQNVDDEDDTCCRPEDIIEELKVEVIKRNMDKDPRYLRALRLLDDADELCREANEEFEKGNYGQAQRLTKEKCENTGEAIRLMIEVLSDKK